MLKLRFEPFSLAEPRQRGFCLDMEPVITTGMLHDSYAAAFSLLHIV